MTDSKKSSVERILDMWSTDAVIDSTQPDKATLAIPVLHAKYIRDLVKFNTKLKYAELDLDKLKKVKSIYYNGKLTEDELAKYGWKQFQHRLLKEDIKVYVEADEDIQELKRKIILYEETVDLCKSILKQLENRSFSLSSYMNWIKMQAGL